jgi:transcriptional regulator of acetoin/glycerol metabolism
MLELPILGLLQEEPLHGYELKKRLDETLGLWGVSFGTLYPALRRLERQGAIEAIEPEAYRRLLSASWPGNVRELQHAIEHAVLVARGPQIRLIDLPDTLQQAEVASTSSVSPSAVPAGSLEDIERASIIKALDSTRWNKQAAAALLGLRRPTLYSKMRKHGIPQRPT